MSVKTMKVAIIGCGGFGMKRLGDLYKQIESLGNVELVAIDGSDSDVSLSGLPADLIHLVDGKDGGGKIRRLNAKDYVAWMDANMHIIPDADLYIVAYTVTGASGSVLGPALTRNLTASGKNVINVCAITGRSSTDAVNAFNTLNGLGSHVRDLGRPIFVSLIDQTKQPASVVDTATCANIIEFSRMASFQYGGLDSADLRSFFDINVHGVKPQLTEIVHFGDDQESRESMVELFSGRVLTQLSLLNSKDGFIPEMMALFDCHGIDEGADPEQTVHYLTSTKSMAVLFKQVTDRQATFTEANKALSTEAVFGEEGGGMKY